MSSIKTSIETTTSDMKRGVFVNRYGSILETTSQKGVDKYFATATETTRFQRYFALHTSESVREDFDDELKQWEQLALWMCALPGRSGSTIMEVSTNVSLGLMRFSPWHAASDDSERSPATPVTTRTVHFGITDSAAKDTDQTISLNEIQLLLGQRPTVDKLLKCLRSDEADLAAKRDAVGQIQMLPIPPHLQEATIEVLVDFIRSHRQSDVHADLVAVGAAIRKVLLNLPSNKLAVANELLIADGRVEIPIEVELEVAKMIVHRLRHEYRLPMESLGPLFDILVENAEIYTRPKMVTRKKYGATGLNCLLAVGLSRHDRAISICQTVMKTAPVWLIETARQRLEDLMTELRLNGDPESKSFLDWIARLPLVTA